MSKPHKKRITIENLSCIVLEFFLPHRFRLKDSIGDNCPGKPYDTAIGGIPARVAIETITDYRYQKAGGLQFGIKPAGVEDRHGTFAFSKVHVWFDDQTFNRKLVDKDFLLNPDNLDILIPLCVDYLNKFITEYRHTSRDHWVRQITRREIFSYRAFLLSKEGETEWMASTNEPDEPIQERETSPKITDDEDQKLRNAIQCEDPFFRSELFLDALEYYRTGKHNMAIILSVTRFENFIYSELKQALSNRKLDKIKKKQECGCMAGIHEVCTRGFKEIFDFDFEAASEWKALQQNALRHRNKIIHGEQLSEVSKEECQEAMDAVAKAEIFVHNNLFRHLDGYTYPKVRN
ncbi:MAG: hypothetical protein ACPGJU_02800 [Coraliomargarita sp.]